MRIVRELCQHRVYGVKCLVMQTKGIENSSHLLSDAQSVRVRAFAKSVLGKRRIPARTLVRAIHSASHAQAYKMVQGEQFWSWSAAKELFQWAESIGYLNCYNEHYNVTFNTSWQTQMDNTLSSPPCYHPLPEDQCWGAKVPCRKCVCKAPCQARTRRCGSNFFVVLLGSRAS